MKNNNLCFKISICASCLVLFWIATAQAELIKSYESETAGFNQENEDLAYDYGNPMVGVTEGDYSLGIGLPSRVTSWLWIGTDWDAPDASPPDSLLNLIQAHSQLRVDVTLMPGSHRESKDFIYLMPVLKGGDIGEHPLTGLKAAPNHDIPYTTITNLIWDYSDVPVLDETQYLQIVWQVQSPDLARSMYIDNVRLEGPPVPEPATVFLLATGGLMFLIRRWL